MAGLSAPGRCFHWFSSCSPEILSHSEAERLCIPTLWYDSINIVNLHTNKSTQKTISDDTFRISSQVTPRSPGGLMWPIIISSITEDVRSVMRNQRQERTGTVCQDDYDTMGGPLLCDQQSASWGGAGNEWFMIVLMLTSDFCFKSIEDFILLVGTSVAFIAFILWCCFPIEPKDSLGGSEHLSTQVKHCWHFFLKVNQGDI